MPDLTEENKPYAVGAIDFGGTKADVALASSDGQILAKSRLITDHTSSAEQIVQTAIQELKTLHTRFDVLDLSALAVASPGIVSDEGIELAPNVQGWKDLQLPHILRNASRIDAVEVGNDVNFAALAESQFGALRSVEVGAYIGLGTGVGAGIIISGRIIAGAHGAAGELGYLKNVDGRSVEDRAGGRAIETHFSSRTGLIASASDILTLRDDPTAADAFDAISELVEAIALTIDPHTIAFGGGLMEAGDSILAAVRKRLQHLPFEPNLRPGDFIHDAVIRGLSYRAAHLAAEAKTSCA